MATQKVTYTCATGCGATKEVEVQVGQPAEAPSCCGVPMKEASRK